MRKLLNTLYVTIPDAYLALDGENVVIYVTEDEKREEKGRYPLHNLDNIVTFGYQGASPALMRHASECGVGLAFFSQHGRFQCRVEGERRGNVLLRREQYRIADDEGRALPIARNMIGAKTANACMSLRRFLRDHELVPEYARIDRAADYLRDSLDKIHAAPDTDALRGLEGVNASCYFGVFDGLILQNHEIFAFDTRAKRPPTDPTNALLSFSYAILANECASALESVGLDPYVGFLHTDRSGRKSLALDLMEEFRAVLCDRFVLSLINRRQVGEGDFYYKENGAVLLGDDGRKTFLSAWYRRKKEVLQHPFLAEKVEWGILPYVQATLLARCIRGDLDEYPPFLWR